MLDVGGGFRVGFILNNFDEERYRPFDPTIRNTDGQVTPATSFWSRVALDQRDLTYDPSKGYYGVLRGGFYGILPSEQEHYFKLDTKLENFFTVFDIGVTENWHFKSVFGVHSGLSFILPQPGRPLAIENVNKLAIDGMFTARGWSGEYSDKGLALWDNWAELRFPIVPGLLAWDFFFDAAVKGVNSLPEDRNTISAFFQHIEPEDWRFSFGGGLRFAMPQLPIRLSLAKKFKIKDGEVWWEQGNIGGDASGTFGGSGFAVVLSFTISQY
jgi:outer membrane protein insertion porin family